MGTHVARYDRRATDGRRFNIAANTADGAPPLVKKFGGLVLIYFVARGYGSANKPKRSRR